MATWLYQSEGRSSGEDPAKGQLIIPGYIVALPPGVWTVLGKHKSEAAAWGAIGGHQSRIAKVNAVRAKKGIAPLPTVEFRIVPYASGNIGDQSTAAEEKPPPPPKRAPPPPLAPKVSPKIPAAKRPDAAAILRRDRQAAVQFAEKAGRARLQKLLAAAQRDLERRLSRAEGLGGAGAGSFTAVQLRAALAQVRAVTGDLATGLQGTIAEAGGAAARASSRATVDYLEQAEAAFTGSVRGLNLDKALLYEQAQDATEASLLRRIAGDPKHKGQPGVLGRYGMAVIGNFEETLQRRLVTGAPWEEVRQELRDSSPFLQGAPASWAERILRTESMYASNMASHQTMLGADEQLGDMLKILSATFDNRTAADSYAVHGEIRRVNEPFDTWYGSMMHPPARPNDREVVVPHRMSWPLPASLAWLSDGAVAARWAQEGRKGGPPARPRRSTVPIDRIGLVAPPRVAPTEAGVPAPPPAEQPPPRTPMAQVPAAMVLTPEPELIPGTLAPTGEQQEFQFKQATVQEKLLEKLDALPTLKFGIDDYVSHGLKNLDDAPAPWVDFGELEKLWGEAHAELAEKLKGKKPPKPKKVKLSTALAPGKDVDKDTASMVMKAPDGSDLVATVTKYKGKKYIQGDIGTSVALKAKLLQQDDFDAHIIDLDAKLKAKNKPAPNLPAQVATAIDPALPKHKIEDLPEADIDFAYRRTVDDRQDFNLKATMAWSQATKTTIYGPSDNHPMLAAVGKFTYGYDFLIRALQHGQDEEALIQLEMKHRGISRAGAQGRIREAKEAIAGLDEVFKKVPPAPPMTVYRGIGKLTRAVFDKFLADDEFEFGATTSTSWAPTVAANFMNTERDKPYRVFFVLKQRSGIPVEPVTNVPGENELIIKKGTRFRATKKLRNEGSNNEILIIEAEEI